jgi:hypothetical protein
MMSAEAARVRNKRLEIEAGEKGLRVGEVDARGDGVDGVKDEALQGKVAQEKASPGKVAREKAPRLKALKDQAPQYQAPQDQAPQDHVVKAQAAHNMALRAKALRIQMPQGKELPGRASGRNVVQDALQYHSTHFGGAHGAKTAAVEEAGHDWEKVDVEEGEEDWIMVREF